MWCIVCTLQSQWVHFIKLQLPWCPNPEVLSSCHLVYVDVDMEPAVFLLKNVAHGFRPPGLFMACSSRLFVFLFFVALVVSPCSPERLVRPKPAAVRQSHGGDGDTQGGQQQGGQPQGVQPQGPRKSDSVEGPGSEEETKGTDPLSGRSVPPSTYFKIIYSSYLDEL